MQNCFIESTGGTFRDECLNLHWFLSLDDAKQTIEDRCFVFPIRIRGCRGAGMAA